MTSRETFLHTLSDETPIFIRVIEALPSDKLNWRPHPRSKSAGEMVAMFASSGNAMGKVANTAKLEATDMEHENGAQGAEPMKAVQDFKKAMERLTKSVSAMTDEQWEKTKTTLTHPGGTWETTMSAMLWGFLFDLIHHRGQLSVYIRPMGGKVPSIYGPSGDSASA
jgi:uncharacterized damage-inducible protein DinB